jgi:uncharacterized repeat protein (TIGR03803 family)
MGNRGYVTVRSSNRKEADRLIYNVRTKGVQLTRTLEYQCLRSVLNRLEVFRTLWLMVRLTLVLIVTLSAQSQTFAVFHSFTGGADGGNVGGESTALIIDAAGNLYGTTNSGGTLNNGVIFKLDLLGNETVLYNFSGGVNGGGGSSLTRDSAGNLYGTSNAGGIATGSCLNARGCGLVYKLDPRGGYTVLHTFTGGEEGANPCMASLALDRTGNLYGATQNGGSHGVLFKLDAAGVETVLHSFLESAGGYNPQGGVIRDSAGNLYGTTLGGGDNTGRCKQTPYLGCGVVFKLDAAGIYSVLHSFMGADGSAPFAALTQNSAGNLFGTTYVGGSVKGGFCRALDGCGVVFKVNTTGKESVVYIFPPDGKHGASPIAGVIRDRANSLYGTAQSGGSSGNGVVFKVDATGNQTVLYSFQGGTDGFDPVGGLVRDSAGNLYGVTGGGGIGPCLPFKCGVVYKITP